MKCTYLKHSQIEKGANMFVGHDKVQKKAVIVAVGTLATFLIVLGAAVVLYGAKGAKNDSITKPEPKKIKLFGDPAEHGGACDEKHGPGCQKGLVCRKADDKRDRCLFEAWSLKDGRECKSNSECESSECHDGPFSRSCISRK